MATRTPPTLKRESNFVHNLPPSLTSISRRQNESNYDHGASISESRERVMGLICSDNIVESGFYGGLKKQEEEGDRREGDRKGGGLDTAASK